MYAVDERFFEEVGFDKSDLFAWGYKSYHDEYGVWYVSLNDAREFCVAIGADPELADV